MTDTNAVQFSKQQTILTDEEFNRLEDWHAIVDAAAEEIDKQLESFEIKDSEHWQWHKAAEELCRGAALELFAKRPKDIADREGYTERGAFTKPISALAFLCALARRRGDRVAAVRTMLQVLRSESVQVTRTPRGRALHMRCRSAWVCP